MKKEKCKNKNCRQSRCNCDCNADIELQLFKLLTSQVNSVLDSTLNLIKQHGRISDYKIVVEDGLLSALLIKFDSDSADFTRLGIELVRSNGKQAKK